MLELPSRFTRVVAAGNLSDTSLPEDYKPTPERWIAFVSALELADELTRNGLAEDGNLRLGSGAVYLAIHQEHASAMQDLPHAE